MQENEFSEIKESILNILSIKYYEKLLSLKSCSSISQYRIDNAINSLLEIPKVREMSSKELNETIRDITESIVEHIRYVEKIVLECKFEDESISPIENSATSNDPNYGKYWRDRMSKDEYDTPGGYFDD